MKTTIRQINLATLVLDSVVQCRTTSISGSVYRMVVFDREHQIVAVEEAGNVPNPRLFLFVPRPFPSSNLTADVGRITITYGLTLIPVALNSQREGDTQLAEGLEPLKTSAVTKLEEVRGMAEEAQSLRDQAREQLIQDSGEVDRAVLETYERFQAFLRGYH